MSKPRFDTSIIAFPNGKSKAVLTQISQANSEFISQSYAIGQAVALVEIQYSEDLLTFAGPAFELVLAQDIAAANLGLFSHISRGQPFQLFFLLDPKTYREALEFIRAHLEKLKILTACTIAIANVREGNWMRFYPDAQASATT
jgi:hypothetical protein